MTRTHTGGLPRPRASAEESPGVVVVCQQALIRDALRAALRERDIPAIAVGTSIGGRRLDEARRWADSMQPAYGLLVTDLDDLAQLFQVIRLMSLLPVPWLVLTPLPPGPAWGALLEAGAAEVLPASTSLDDLSARLAARNIGSAGTAQGTRERLLLAWRRISDEQRLLQRRLGHLSSREMEVLQELQQGHSVRVIAARAGVSEGTVRTQVKSLLKKLGVNSQLQAVAYYREASAWLRG